MPKAMQHAPGRDSTTPRTDAHGELLAQAREHTSPPAFLSAALRSIAKLFASPYAAIYMPLASEVLQDDCHAGGGDPGFWQPSIRQLLTDTMTDGRARAKLLRARGNGARMGLLSAPMYDPAGRACGALAIVAPEVTDASAAARLALLQSLASLASYAANAMSGAAPRAAGPTAADANPAAVGRMAGFGSEVEIAYSVTNALRNKIGGEQIALGVLVRRHIRILSISGLDEVRPRAPGVQALRGAMEECADATETIICQGGADWDAGQGGTARFRLHEHWRGMAQGDAVASIPLRAGENIVAVLSLRRRSDQPFRAEELERVRASVEQIVPSLELTRRATRGLTRHVVESVNDALDHLRRPGRITARILAAAGVFAAAWFLFGTMDYRLSVKCVVAPATLRRLAAPYDAMVAEALVSPGDFVRAGQPLYRLETRDLEQQEAQLQAEWSVAERQRDHALAQNNPAEARLADATQHLLRTRLDILRRRIELARPRAPFDGIVIDGDLRRNVGSVVQRGQPLLSLAPTGAWSVRLDVPEYAAADLAAGLPGDVACRARPEQSQPFRVSHVHGSSELREGKSVFVAEADLRAAPEWLRPGMEGVARVDLGPRRVWWVLLHRAVDYLHLNWWM